MSVTGIQATDEIGLSTMPIVPDESISVVEIDIPIDETEISVTDDNKFEENMPEVKETPFELNPTEKKLPVLKQGPSKKVFSTSK